MRLHNLGNRIKKGYTTWGCMWEKGSCLQDSNFCLENIYRDEKKLDEDSVAVPVQSRITAYWPDGTVKWTAHTADSALLADEIEVRAVAGGKGGHTELQLLTVERQGGKIIIHAGAAEVVLEEGTGSLLSRFSFRGTEVLTGAEPVLLLEEHDKGREEEFVRIRKYKALILGITLEERGPLQAVIRYEGTHIREDGERRIPFIIRMRIGYDSPELGFEHTFLYDGEEDRDFLKGLGIRFLAPLSGPVYNRHVKFEGDYGVFHESCAQLLSWRPRVPDGIYEAQMRGEMLCPEGEDGEVVNTVLRDMPFWDEFVFTQDSVSHFSVKKKIKDENCCYIDCLHGGRSNGGAALGSEHGSVLFSIRDFWEKYPSGYTFSGMTGNTAEAVVWLWSPEAVAMDFRHYANRGYNQVYYEGYDYKGADPFGIACTSEFSVAAAEAVIPSDEEVVSFAERVKFPVHYVGTPEFYHEMKAFGRWSLPGGDTEVERWLEEQLDRAADFYRDEVKQRNWHGMFNYGDFMHTYDRERHQWRYDCGGYAWDNTELVPTLWLWYAFLRTGREDVFLLAEKLSRHASEVDVYHIGRYKGLGSRHNVRHWGCPCKEARIAMAGHHRVYYYLTGDRRFEDIFDELKDNERTFLNRDPLGDFYDKEEMVYPSHARSGPDWSSLCANWLTEWERKNDTVYRDKIIVGMNDIRKAPLRLVSGPDFEFDPESVHLRYIGERAAGGTHLQICMGAPQIWMEMADLLEDEDWKQMMAEYGRFYYLPREEQMKESGGLIGDREFSLPFMAAAMGAYGAERLGDKALAERTWMHLLHALIGGGCHDGFKTTAVLGRGNQEELREIPWISTNFAAQWCLNVICALEFIREYLPETLQEADRLAAGLDEGSFRKA